MESLHSSLRPAEDHSATVRRRNKRLIQAFFVLILAVAVITGGIIVFLIRNHNLESRSQSSKPHPAIREYCRSENNCMLILLTAVKSTPESTPTQIFRMSLETAVRRISKLATQFNGSYLQPHPRFESTAQICSSSLHNSVSQLNHTVDSMGPDPDEQTRDAMLEEVTAAGNDLQRCLKALNGVLLAAAGDETAAPLFANRAEVDDAKSMVEYGGDFLWNFYTVNENFYFVDSEIRREGWNRFFDDWVTVTLFGSCYFVLVFLFCLLLRIY